MKKRNIISRLCTVFVFLTLLIVIPIKSFGTPLDENFDSAGVGDKGTQSYTLNGVTYTTNDSGGLNINIVNDGNIAAGAEYALGYRSSGVNNTTQVTFKTSDGSEFKLNSFVISTGLGDTTVTIKGYRDNAEVSSSSATTASFTTFNVAGDASWQYIDEVRMTGADLDIDIDDVDFSDAVPPTYSVTYNGNTNTGGSVPTDGNSYINGDTVTVLGNTGTLLKTGYTFAGWNTAANGSGTSYSGGNTFAMGISNVTLYAQWTAVDYSVTYNGNTNTGGSVPTDGTTYNITDTVTVLGNTGTLLKTGYTFAGWNTAANGSGTSYNGGDTFAMGSSNVTLYAQWTENTYSVTYNGNSNTGGSVPVDATSYHNGDTATVLGNTGSLTRVGYTFAGWNTAANGSGTSYSGGDTFGIGISNITLYAQWTAVNYTVTYNGNTNTGGSVPTDGSTYHITDTVTLLGNTGSLTKTGYTFASWNTAANGSGTSYSGGDTFAMGSSNVTLYAQWTENTYSVTYNGNSNTGGSAPVDATSYYTGDTVTVLGNTGSLTRTGYTFAGWNTEANGTGTSYPAGSTFAIGSNNVTLYAKWIAVDYTVTYDGNTNTGGSVPTDATTYNITNTVTVLGNTGTLLKTGYTFAGWNTAADGSGASYSTGDTFAMGSSNVTLYAKWTISGGSSSGTSSTPPQETIIVIVNGEEQTAGTEIKSNEDGTSTVTLEVNAEAIESEIDEAINNNTTGEDNIVQIPVADSTSQVVKVELTGDIIKKLEENNFEISVQRDNIEYIIPAEEFTILKVAENLGVPESDLVEIKIEVKITKLDESVIEKYNEVAKANGAELIFPPVAFEVVAKTTQADGTTDEIGINQFNNYVERVMEIPDGVDPSKITTGIVFNTDGSYSHVPTTVYQKDDKWYASLNSLTNSNYSVIWSNITVKSVLNHWAKDAVNDMASRLVIFDAEKFEPNKAITRADFAEYIVRALGLYREGSTHKNNFKDVSINEERILAILIANDYGIITGYLDGTFKPDQEITREEAMVMYQRAMKLTKLTGSDTTRYQKYKDFVNVSSWAKSNVKEVLSAHVFNGTSTTTISPKSKLTYAEAAQAIKNLLVESKLINN